MAHHTYRIEARDTRHGWVPAPGESTGWTLTAARRAVRAGIGWHDGTPIDSDDVRIVREADDDSRDALTAGRSPWRRG